MMINWAEKQAPEDRQATEDVAGRNDARWNEGAAEAFVESGGRARAMDNLVTASV